MNTFRLEGSEKTPNIEGDIAKGKLSMSGECVPENAQEMFASFHEWLEEFYINSPENVEIIFDLEYFNTPTAKIILDIMRKFADLAENRNVKIIWLYEEYDEDMEETGSDYKVIVGDLIDVRSK